MNQRFAHKQTVRAVSRAHDRHDGLRLHDRRHRHGEIRRRALPPRLQSGQFDRPRYKGIPPALRKIVGYSAVDLCKMDPRGRNLYLILLPSTECHDVLRGVVDLWVRKCVRRAGGRGETRAAAQQKARFSRTSFPINLHF